MGELIGYGMNCRWFRFLAETVSLRDVHSCLWDYIVEKDILVGRFLDYKRTCGFVVEMWLWFMSRQGLEGDCGLFQGIVWTGWLNQGCPTSTHRRTYFKDSPEGRYCRLLQGIVWTGWLNQGCPTSTHRRTHILRTSLRAALVYTYIRNRGWRRL